MAAVIYQRDVHLSIQDGGDASPAWPAPDGTEILLPVFLAGKVCDAGHGVGPAPITRPLRAPSRVPRATPPVTDRMRSLPGALQSPRNAELIGSCPGAIPACKRVQAGNPTIKQTNSPRPRLDAA